MIYFITFKYVPMLGVVVAFKDYNVFKGIFDSQWIGFDAFREIFRMDAFIKAIRNTFVLNLLDLVVGFPIPIILALLLNEVRVKWFKRSAQTLLYLPHFISWVFIGGMATQLLATNSGSVNIFLNSLGFESIPFLSDKTHWVMTYLAAGFWREAGWGTILYLAALTGINKELYEAADVDGATRLRKMWHITLPGIKPTIVILLILNVGHMAAIGFDRPFLLGNPGVRDVSEVISTYVYTVGIQSARYTIATAIGLFQAIIGLIFLLSADFISRKVNDQGIW
ncbi:ABC transporter permease [Paenibacillus castaneae]|uniref:ABC transporter permease n=1 Tax=Paenibacillus castaneae TaxID=474957 RepID=UPI000C998AEA|nr:ABC transporter permease subunit [Paenibacillus castaneae]